MEKIFDDTFVSKVVRRKIRKNIVQASFDLDWLSFDVKVNFAFNRLNEIPYTKVRILISFWEKFENIQSFLQSSNCKNWKLLREHKFGKKKPGQLEIYFENCIDEKFILSMIKKHYGYELGKPESLSLELVFVFQNMDDITICHLYDDRGFNFFYANP